MAVREGSAQVLISEWNVNQLPETVVRGIHDVKADAVFFSVYIWNRDFVFRVAEALRLIHPGLLIGAGGPEVSQDPSLAFADCPALDLILSGEGEGTFSDLTDLLAMQGVEVPGENEPTTERVRILAFGLGRVPGLVLRGDDGAILSGGIRPLIDDLASIPFPYGFPGDSLDPSHRIAYYESSRGCPFRCAYCLSSVERSVRFYPLERVFADLDFFLERQWPLVKFVDRTFNVSPARYRAIWNRIAERHNGVTRFHFEISADLLTDEDFEILGRMPEGAIQFEIGVQSANGRTLEAVSRATDLTRLGDAVRRIPGGIHTHVDLIAGLPFEGLESFRKSFEFVWALGADVIQLGFLKILAGTQMERLARQDPGYRWVRSPPYEILSSPCLSYDDLITLKKIEHVVDNLWNSGLFKKFFSEFPKSGMASFDMFNDVARFISNWFPDRDVFLPRKPLDLFACMAEYATRSGVTGALEWLKFDFFAQAKPGKIPPWVGRDYSKEAHDAALEDTGFLGRCGGVRRIAYARSEFETFHFPGEDGSASYLFEYPSPERKSAGTKAVKLGYNGAQGTRRNRWTQR